MANPSAANQPYTGADSNTIAATDKTATFVEVQGADTAANAQAFGAVISDLDSDLKSVTVSVNAADVKTGDQLLLAGVALDMSQAAGAQTVTVNSKAFSVSIAADGSAPAVLTIQSLDGTNAAAKPVADFNALLATLKFNNTSDNPDPAAREFRLGATDATDTEAQIAKFTVDIDPTNDIPVVTASSSSAAFVEIDGPSDTSVAAASQGVAIDAGITVTNRDDPQEGDIVSAVVEITSNASTGDELLFVNQTKVVLDTSKTNTPTKLHLKAVDGTTTTADFEAALRLVEFNNTSETPSEATRTVTFTVTDAATTTGETPKTHTATRDVTVQATEDSPVVDMASPSAANEPYTGATAIQLHTDKTATFVEVQGADTAANAQAFGAVISDLDSDLKSVTVSIPAADVKSWRPVITSWCRSRYVTSSRCSDCNGWLEGIFRIDCCGWFSASCINNSVT